MDTGKDLRISNLKGLLIFLVVFGHFIEIYKNEYYEFFVFIYAFHMPLFIFISGYLAKRMRISKIINLVMLYLIFQTFFNVVLYFTGDLPLQFTYGKPHFHLWYIVSMGFWYSIVWIITKVNLKTFGKWMAFIIIFAISCMSRWYTDVIVEAVQQQYDNFTSYTLSYQRTLSFMPFFFVGYFLDKEFLQGVCVSIKSKLVALILLSMTIFITFFYLQDVYGMESVFRGSFGIHRYLEDGEGMIVYLVKIGIHYLLAFWLCYLLFVIISSRANTLTKWGDNSLTIFLFHPIFVFVIRQTEFMEEWTPDTKLALYLFTTLLVTVVLGSNWFFKITKWACNPYKTLEKTFKVSRD